MAENSHYRSFTNTIEEIKHITVNAGIAKQSTDEIIKIGYLHLNMSAGTIQHRKIDKNAKHGMLCTTLFAKARSIN